MKASALPQQKETQAWISAHFDGNIIVDKKLNILFSDAVYTSIISQLDCVKISNNRFGIKAPAIQNKLE